MSNVLWWILVASFWLFAGLLVALWLGWCASQRKRTPEEREYDRLSEQAYQEFLKREKAAGRRVW